MGKGKKQLICLDDFKKMQGFRRLINTTRLEDLTFCDGKKTITVTPKMIRDWKFTGLSNCDFVEFKLLGEEISR